MSKQRSINEINEDAAFNYTPIHARQDAGDYVLDAEAYHAVAKSRKGGVKKVLVVVLVVLLAVLLAAGTAFGLYAANIGDILNRGTKSEGELIAIQEKLAGSPTSFDEVFYMLLIGSDARNDDEPARSDVNIVARIDPVENSVSLLSIPRDTKIKIEGYGTQKFNAAYAFDKVPGVIDATEDLLGIKISHYAEVDFTGLKDLVDAVGGVTVDVEGDIDDPHCDDGDGNHYVLEEGEQLLSGGEALTYARSRYSFSEGDFARASHQRQIIEAILKKVLEAPVTELPSIISAMAKCVTTDIKLNDMVGLAQQFANVDDVKVLNAMVPSYPQTINGIAFVVVDDTKMKKLLRLYKKGKDCSSIVSTKEASSINDYDIDTSQTYVDEVTSGWIYSSSGSTSSGSGRYSGTSSSSGSTSGGWSDSSGRGSSSQDDDWYYSGGSTGSGNGSGGGSYSDGYGTGDSSSDDGGSVSGGSGTEGDDGSYGGSSGQPIYPDSYSYSED